MVINITGLSLAIAFCVLIALFVNSEYDYDQFHKSKNELYRLVVDVDQKGAGLRKIGYTNNIQGREFQEALPEIKGVVRFFSSNSAVRHGQTIQNENILYADSNFFAVFTFPLLLGSPTEVLKHVNNVVITEEVARRYFGKTDVVGELFEIFRGDHFDSFIISGIAKIPPKNSSIKFGIVLPYQSNKEFAGDNQWTGFYLNTFVMIDSAAHLPQLEQKINHLFSAKAKGELSMIRENAKVDLKIRFRLQHLLDLHLAREYAEDKNGLEDSSNVLYSSILITIALFILAIASINFINLTLSQAITRSKEVGIRKVVGSNRIAIIFQFLSESFFLCVVSFVIALLLSALMLPSLNWMANKHIDLSDFLGARMSIAFLALLFGTCLISGWYPAFVMSVPGPMKALSISNQLKRRFGLSLVVVQFYVATSLLLSAVVVFLQFNFIENLKLGYNDENVMVIINAMPTSVDDIRLFKTKLTRNTGILNACAQVDEKVEKVLVNHIEIDCESISTDEDYLNTLNIPLQSGRNFLKSFSTDSTTGIIVNETFVKRAQLGNSALGSVVEFIWNNSRMKIIGVVKDYHTGSAEQEIKPLVLKMYPNERYPTGIVKVKLSGLKEPLSQIILTEFKEAFPYQPFQYSFLKAINAKYLEANRNWKRIITIATGAVIFICLIGLFGLCMISAQSRTKEIAIRKIAGSSDWQIVQMLSKRYVGQILLATFLAIPTVFYLEGKWLANFAFRVDISIWKYFLSCAAILVIGFLPIFYHSLKATKKNPVDSLRTE
ncbi:hypothetical protein DYBT9275_03911 [Dyadobacter sp. CECT 9275]|uniref:FtsX-like permease family protein n=1 Tax=Dyadobacter helix TaxID=2822344 RepID=A0A916N5U0_9BACT|nr:ABC transporter permease [Dyadobacter sp. CECT 9275]CAG5006859.1 hypothetical protein DYBT9275_03911 [Dyadobacter sp. CECT 9275]